jgi:cytochrome b pre-mRNA-processing protein 3
MSLLKRLFGSSEPDPKFKLVPLYNQIVAHARQPHWYEKGQVPDSLDGRFDMVAAVLTLVLLRLEASHVHAQDMAYLTEVFVDDMDGQLRESGVGDVIVGKYMGKMMSALGGRLVAFRAGLAQPEALDEAIMRNIYRGDIADPTGLAHVRKGLLDLGQSLAAQLPEQIVEGNATW